MHNLNNVTFFSFHHEMQISGLTLAHGTLRNVPQVEACEVLLHHLPFLAALWKTEITEKCELACWKMRAHLEQRKILQLRPLLDEPTCQTPRPVNEATLDQPAQRRPSQVNCKK